MEIRITKTEISKNSLSTKIILALVGVFLTSIIFAISMKWLEEIGIWIGIALTGILVFCGYYFFEPGNKIRIITWTMLATLIITILFYILGLQYISSSLEGL